MLVGNENYKDIANLPSSIPIFPLSGALLLPHGQMPLNIFEPRYLSMVDEVIGNQRMIGMIQPAFKTAKASLNGLCTIGCAGRVTSFGETGDGRYSIILAGVSRFEIGDELQTTTPFRQIRPNWQLFADDLQEDQSQREVDRGQLLKTFQIYLEVNDMKVDWESIEQAETGTLVNALSMMCPYGPPEKQALLEAKNWKERAETLVAITEISLARAEKNTDVTLQ